MAQSTANAEVDATASAAHDGRLLHDAKLRVAGSIPTIQENVVRAPEIKPGLKITGTRV